MIDAATNQRLDEEYKLGGEPESFQLEKYGPNIYVNVPDLKDCGGESGHQADRSLAFEGPGKQFSDGAG
jgi:hypothetical protein